MKLTRLLLTAALVTLTTTARADVKLASVFADHMVLQRDTVVPVWGWADPGEEVTVTIGGQSKSARADANGRWSVRLDKLAVGEPRTLTVAGKNKLTVQDVLVGEVWLCSGQSNMAMNVKAALDFDREQPTAKWPSLRMFTVERSPAREPQTDCRGSWEVCTPESVARFSATAYFFGREVHERLGVPVGLINSSYGGTDITAWTSLDAQQAVPELKPVLDSWDRAAATWDPVKARAAYETNLAKWKTTAAKAKADGKTPPRGPEKPIDPRDDRNHPATLYNGMIAPLVPYALRGTIWYQGEHNARTDEAGYLYRLQLPLLVNDWRNRWGQGDFPFAWVQLPNIVRVGDGWPMVRESMLESLRLPNSGMAIAIDVGDPNDVHPKNKQAIGHRLALWALGAVYGLSGPTSGPLPDGFEVRGSEVVVRFKHADGGLVAKEGTLKGFVIAAADKTWQQADARIDGNSIVVSSPKVPMPVAVRYAWSDNPDANLCSGVGLPASPFRTDVAPPVGK